MKIKTYKTDCGNTARIEYHYIRPYKGSPIKEAAYRVVVVYFTCYVFRLRSYLLRLTIIRAIKEDKEKPRFYRGSFFAFSRYAVCKRFKAF